MAALESFRQVVGSKAGALYDATAASMQKLLDNLGETGQPPERAGQFTVHLIALFSGMPFFPVATGEGARVSWPVKDVERVLEQEGNSCGLPFSAAVQSVGVGNQRRGDLATEVDLTALEDHYLTSFGGESSRPDWNCSSSTPPPEKASRDSERRPASPGVQDGRASRKYRGASRLADQ